MIRRATLADIAALVDLETRSFRTDLLTRRSFRYLLTRATAETLVAVEPDDRVLGYVMTLFHRSTSLSRLYSIAVEPEARGQGLGWKLLQAAINGARQRGAAYMRLEVRADDETTQALYRKAGFRKFGTHADYYEDGMDAVRMEASLAPHLDPRVSRVPYYGQNLDFTCGPATLMMAMRALDPSFVMDPKLELRLWRESTTIFMTSGHGGCSPWGMALAAHRRGFGVEVHVSDPHGPFLDTVRGEEKKRVLRLVEEDFLDQVRAEGIPIHLDPLSLDGMERAFHDGAIPIVLISWYRLGLEKIPHWVVVTGFGEGFVYIHDPYIDDDDVKSQTDCMDIPVPIADFERMARYGRSRQKAALLIRRRRTA